MWKLRALLPIFFGGIFPLAVAYALGSLWFPRVALPRAARFAIGAAMEATAVFFLLLAGFANWIVFLTGGVIAIVAMWRISGGWQPPRRMPSCPTSGLVLGVIFAAYGVLYLVHALTPETEPDAVGYHLGLASEYVRLGRFPARVGFFEMVPQGLEMLFTIAFAFGKHSAAKLVHLGFLIATVPLLRGIGRRLQLPDVVSIGVAAIYFCAPVVGVSAACAYNDAAGVFFVLAAFDLLLIWREEKRVSHLIAAGLLAGFCFAIKFTGLLIAPLAVLFVLVHGRRIQPAMVVAGAAAVMIAPWMIRNAIMTGNPLAPLFNTWFPNAYFHAETERRLTAALRSYGSNFSLRTAPLDYTIWGRLQGLAGPGFLLLPLGLLSLRSRAGRLVWVAGIAAAIPLYWNVGARFLMPALPFFALAIAMALPRIALWLVVAIQAVACWPLVVPMYADENAWRLDGFPWEAALRIEPESHYLERMLGQQYLTAPMVNANTSPSDSIFCLMAPPRAYITRETLEYWHSSDAEQFTRAMTVGLFGKTDSRVLVRADWPDAALISIRFPINADGSGEWRLFEVRLFSRGERLNRGQQRWRTIASPNAGDARWAIDGNLTTFWRTFDPVRKGMFYQIDFEHPLLLSGAAMLCDSPGVDYPTEWQGLGADRKWRQLAEAPRRESVTNENLQPEAVRAVRDGGFTHILVPIGAEGTEQIGQDMYEHPEMWGVADVAHAGKVHLFKIKGARE